MHRSLGLAQIIDRLLREIWLAQLSILEMVLPMSSQFQMASSLGLVSDISLLLAKTSLNLYSNTWETEVSRSLQKTLWISPRRSRSATDTFAKMWFLSLKSSILRLRTSPARSCNQINSSITLTRVFQVVWQLKSMLAMRGSWVLKCFSIPNLSTAIGAHL